MICEKHKESHYIWDHYKGVWWRHMPTGLLTVSGQFYFEQDPNLSTETFNKLLQSESALAHNWLLANRQGLDPYSVADALLSMCIAEYSDAPFGDIVCRYAEARNEPVIISACAILSKLRREGNLTYFVRETDSYSLVPWSPCKSVLVDSNIERCNRPTTMRKKYKYYDFTRTHTKMTSKSSKSMSKSNRPELPLSQN